MGVTRPRIAPGATLATGPGRGPFGSLKSTSEGASVSDRIVARTVWVLAALALAVTAFGIWYDVRNALGDESFLFVLGAIAWALLPATLVLSGALIVSRQPHNIIGLLLMIPGLVFLAAGVIDVSFGSLEQGVQPEAMTVGLWLRLWFDNWSWVLLIFPIFHLMLAFPTGRLLSSRWRWIVGLEIAMILFMMFASAFTQEMGPLNVEDDAAWTLPNPIGFLPESFFGADVRGLLECRSAHHDGFVAIGAGAPLSAGVPGGTSTAQMAVVRRYRFRRDLRDHSGHCR